ncbi:MAG: glycoside hydrolase family 95 protein [Oscillospiraceae bacterium]|nr:glycoside hydrolase family 95 protein [Oscillospiraceae bacterium]
MKHPYHLRYDAPAEAWTEAMPLGNGRLGAMVYGRPDIEKIILNDDSLWYGGYVDRNNPAMNGKLPEIQKLVLAGKIREAEELIMQYMVGSPSGMRHYTFLGQLDLALNEQVPFIMGGRPDKPGPEKYISDLDLMTGVLNIDHTQNGVSYSRETFISYPAQVMCIRLTADTPKAINLNLMMRRTGVGDMVGQDSRRPGMRTRGGSGWPGINCDTSRAIDDSTFLMAGKDSDIAFAVAARVECDGDLINPVTQLLANNCQEVTIYVASSTSNRAADPSADVIAKLNAAQAKGYAALREEHVADFSALMGRCDIDVGPAPAPEMMTDKRILAVREGANDPALAAMYFQLGRYLIVAGGREGSIALNLQGIWNAEFNPSWDSKYTININTQMNYWPVETTNLSELHMPLLDLLEKMHDKGKETAKVMYGMRGMVCHHNTDFYGDCAPQDWFMAATPWMTGAPWLGLHIWEHYLHTHDVKALERAYPIFKDMCLFFEDFLIEVDGKLLTCPSVSPENRYVLPDGHDTPICAAPAMDNQILREFFAMCVEIQKVLGVDADYSQTLLDMAAKLPEDKIGSKGQLLEWDKEYPELTPGMGHVSHLFACYPGSSINWRDTPELLKAVNRSLELRCENGAGRGGWPLAWYICINARMFDGAKTDDNIRTMLGNSAARNFLNARRVFQIDGNCGVVAGIAECLLQSHVALHFLPALPVSWADGSVKGFVARGGNEIDMEWKGGKLTCATVKPRFGGAVEVVGDTLAVACGENAVPTAKTDIGFSFDAVAGKTYTLTPQ